VIRQATGTSAIDREFNELWKKSMDAIGVRMEFQPGKFADQLKATKACQLTMWSAAWLADYPDGDNFMQILYGRNIYQSNNACAQIPEYDKLYEQTQKLPNSPERDRLYHEMAKIIEAYAPWRLDISRYRNMLAQPWVVGYKKHPILRAEWQYIDVAARAN
jgi:ABC-type oligopeptide transport system substrate-binding subunit